MEVATMPERALKTEVVGSLLSPADFALLEALLIRARLDPADFRLGIQQVHQPIGFANVKALVTVTCREARISRTYFSRVKEADWVAGFSDDLEAGVFRGR